MNIKYGTLTNYIYHMTHHNGHKGIYELQHEILSRGALDPADPQTRNLIGQDLYDSATQNDVLFYQTDVKYIQNTIHTDNIYRILPQDPYIAIQMGDYLVEKLIVNYEYFLDTTNPPQSTKRALICTIGSIMNFMTSINPKFSKQLANDRPFIQRWFEKIR